MQSYINDINALGIGDVSSEDQIRNTFSTDASLCTVTPQVIVAPRTEQDVVKIVRFVTRHKKDDPTLSITPRAGGTGMDGGALGASIVLDMTKYFTHIGKVHAVGDTYEINLEPGVMYRDLEKILDTHNLIVPSYTGSKEMCTIGGMVANNAGGEYSLGYGATGRFVRSLRVVLYDGTVITTNPLTKEELEEKQKQKDTEGELYRAVAKLLEQHGAALKKATPHTIRNTSGYALLDVIQGEMFDLTPLFVGSQGTLGIITSVTLAPIEKPKKEQSIVMTLDSLSVLSRVVNKLLEYGPVSVEMFDQNIYHIAQKFHPEYTHGLITTPTTAITLMARFVGDNSVLLEDNIDEVLTALSGTGVHACTSATEEEARNYWRVRRIAFDIMHNYIVGDRRIAPVLDDVFVPVEKLAIFLPEYRALLGEYFMTYTLSGHIGEGNIRALPFVDMSNFEERRMLLEVAERVFELTRRFGGTIAGENNDGIVRTPFVEKLFGEEVYSVFLELKKVFDPNYILNPGKKVRGTKAFIEEHFIKEN